MLDVTGTAFLSTQGLKPSYSESPLSWALLSPFTMHFHQNIDWTILTQTVNKEHLRTATPDSLVNALFHALPKNNLQESE
jgi:hypothetical protein